MKRRVRIYKAQLGGAQALQEQQAQVQEQSNDQALLASIVAKLDEEEMSVMPEDILRDLMNAGVEQEKAARLVRAAMDLKEERDALSQAENEGDQDAVNDLEADQQALADQAEEDRQDAILAQMYESDAYDDGYDEEDQFVQDNIMESNLPTEKMGGMPNKRSFVKKATKVIKAQMGQEMAPPAKADSTDTGVRQMMMASFLKSVQDTGNNALIKKDAEQAYDITSMYPYSEDNTPQAQFGGTRGQQRRMNRRINRMIGHMPIPMNGMMPAGFVTYPMLQNAQQYMPSEGSYYGGPRLANIDVHRTGLFGRPKEYTITFAQEAFENPTLRKQVIKQEARNRKILTEDEVDELLKKEEEITGKTTETAKAEEKKEAEGRRDISGSGASSRQNTSSTRVNPVVQQSPAVEEETAAVEQTPAPWESALQGRNPEWMGDVNFQANQGYVNPMDAAMQNYARDKQTFNTGAYPSGPGVVTAKSAYSNKTTSPDLFYYNPDKPGYSYVFRDGKLYYDDATDAAQSWHEIKDPARIQTLNEKLKGADIYTLPGKAGVYYRQRPDGAYAKFEGDPAKHSVSAKQVAVIKPGSKNYDYLNKNKQYSYSFSGKMQVGGFTDASSGLTKFVYGGNEYGLPETGGKLVNSPYFEEGGFLPEAEDGKDVKRHIVRAYQDGKFVGYMDQETADKYGLYWESATEDNATTETTDDGYNSNPQSVYPGGTYFKQTGMPYFTGTGDPYAGYITPWTDLKSIEVKNRLLGAPKLTYNFGNYDPTAPLIGPKSTTTTAVKPVEDFREKRRFDPKMPYKVRETLVDKMHPFGGRWEGWMNTLFNRDTGWRPEKEEIPTQAYGGDMDYAQVGENYPYVADPRFAPVYTDNPDFVGMTDIDLITPDVTGLVSAPVGIGDQSIFAGYDPSAVNTVDASGKVISTEVGTPDITQTTAYQQAQKDPTMNLEIDPNQPNRQTQKKNLVGDFSIPGKLKGNKTNAQYLADLMAFNSLANSALGLLGERGDAQRQAQLRNRYLADNLYGSTGLRDRGTYEINSGLFRPDQMGFTGVAKEGGAMYKEGGTHYMSAAQVKKFLEEGGELEFV
jgi:hypothetical protein